MKAKLNLKNIKGIREAAEFHFESGKVNIIKAPNAAGKTSVIDGMAAALSFPVEGEFAKEAARMGIKGRKSQSDFSPLVNIYSAEGSVELEINGKTKRLELRKDGVASISDGGDMRFLMGGVLKRESRITRQLLEGDGDFGWIVRQLSFSDRYRRVRIPVEEMYDEVVEIVRELESHEEKIMELEKNIKELTQENEELEEQHEEISKRLSEEISKAEGVSDEVKSHYEELKNRQNKIQSEIEEFREEKEKKEKKIAEKKTELRKVEKLEKKKNRLQKRKERLDERVQDLRKELKQLEERVKQKSQESLNRVVEINNEISQLREKRGEKRGVQNLVESALQIIGEEGEAECPLCGGKIVRSAHLEEQMERTKGEIQKLNEQIMDEESKRDRIKSELEKLKAQRETKNKELKRMVKERNEAKEAFDAENKKFKEARNKTKRVRQILDQEKQRVEELDQEIAKSEKELEDLQEELRKVEESIEEQKVKEKEEIKELTGKRERLNERIKNNEETIKKLRGKHEELATYEVLPDWKLPTEKALELYKRWKGTLTQVLDYLENRIEEQEKGALKKFNNKVEDLLQTLNFQEFQRIYLDEEYHLWVTREGSARQVLSSLSGSERTAIAVLLQIAVKEAYLPDIPFFIIDEPLLNFDQQRLTNILDYLSQRAKERDEFVVLAKVVGEGPLKVSTWE